MIQTSLLLISDNLMCLSHYVSELRGLEKKMIYLEVGRSMVIVLHDLETGEGQEPGKWKGRTILPSRVLADSHENESSSTNSVAFETENSDIEIIFPKDTIIL